MPKCIALLTSLVLSNRHDLVIKRTNRVSPMNDMSRSFLV